mmetsp:Transcript_7020/g.16918  ORF Transcript_7020/g.16918 Transcript_7020/m.16918 type:complete len:162 (-) Transcript_7020:210-695(-)
MMNTMMIRTGITRNATTRMAKAVAGKPTASTTTTTTTTTTTVLTSNFPNTNNTNATIFRRGMATKKAGGSTNNGRDSIGRRLGVKILHNQPATAGSILVRQRGQKFRAGENVGMGKDHTLFAKIAGVVRMEKIVVKNGISRNQNKRKIKNVVHVAAAAASL